MVALGMVVKIEDVDNPFPYGLALVRLLDGDGAGRAWFCRRAQKWLSTACFNWSHDINTLLA